MSITAMIVTAMTITAITITPKVSTAMIAIAMHITALFGTEMTATAMAVTALNVTALIITPLASAEMTVTALIVAAMTVTAVSSQLQPSFFEGSLARNAFGEVAGARNRVLCSTTHSYIGRWTVKVPAQRVRGSRSCSDHGQNWPRIGTDSPRLVLTTGAVSF